MFHGVRARVVPGTQLQNLALAPCAVCEGFSRNHPSPWHSVVQSGRQEVRGFFGNDGLPENLAGETSVGNLREAVRRMLLTALSA